MLKKNNDIFAFDKNITKKELLFEIISDKKIYQISKPIKLKLIFKNNLSKDIIFNKRLGIDEYNTPHELREVIFDIIKPSGKRASLQVDILRDKIKEEEFIILKNKAKYIKDIILSDYYIDEFSEIGLYTISATYENTTKSHGTSVEAWIGKIKSNIIAVVIKK